MSSDVVGSDPRAAGAHHPLPEGEGAGPGRPSRPPRAATGSLFRRYQVMAFTTATLLIVLVFAGVPLQFAAGKPELANVVGTLHGVLYVVYLYVAFRLTLRLGIPKWQMVLVLLAGTVPFCAFVAEAKLRRRVAATGALAPPEGEAAWTSGGRPSLRSHASAARRRWLSRRALLLHLEMVVVASGCFVAGWWQATRALAGNRLSWVYSVEWPIFALLAIGAWWQLVHEDEAAWRARKGRRPSMDAARLEAEDSGSEVRRGVDPATRRLAVRLAAGVGAEVVIGIMAVLAVPFDRPAGFVPDRGVVIYLTHSVLGFFLTLAAAALVVLTRRSGRSSKAIAWMGLIGILLAGLGGLLTAGSSGVRFLGVATMLVGAVWAGFSYLLPALTRPARHEGAGAPGEAGVASPSPS